MRVDERMAARAAGEGGAAGVGGVGGGSFSGEVGPARR